MKLNLILTYAEIDMLEKIKHDSPDRFTISLGNLDITGNRWVTIDLQTERPEAIWRLSQRLQIEIDHDKFNEILDRH